MNPQPLKVAVAMLIDIGQLQFFVYVYLAIALFAKLRNNITVERLRRMTIYSAIILLIVEWGHRYRIRAIEQSGESLTESHVFTLLMFVFTIGGFWTAYLIDRISEQQRGWLYIKLRDGLLRGADLMETRLNPVVGLRKLADRADARGKALHPAVHAIRQVDKAAVERVQKIVEEVS